MQYGHFSQGEHGLRFLAPNGELFEAPNLATLPEQSDSQVRFLIAHSMPVTPGREQVGQHTITTHIVYEALSTKRNKWLINAHQEIGGFIASGLITGDDGSPDLDVSSRVGMVHNNHIDQQQKILLIQLPKG